MGDPVRTYNDVSPGGGPVRNRQGFTAAPAHQGLADADELPRFASFALAERLPFRPARAARAFRVALGLLLIPRPPTPIPAAAT